MPDDGKYGRIKELFHQIKTVRLTGKIKMKNNSSISNKILIVYISLFFFCAQNLFAQNTGKTVNQAEQAWVGLFTQTRLSKRWGIWLDLHQRFTDHFVGRPLQAFARVGGTYYITDDIRLVAGYAFVWFYKGPGEAAGHLEHRPWQQISIRQSYNRFSTMQWLRLEQRFVQKLSDGVPTNDFKFNWRIRYSYGISIPLNHKKLLPKTWFIALQNELFINFGSQITYNYFDQNRLFGGIGYQFNKAWNAQLGYMNVFQQTATGNVFQNANCIRLYVYYNLDLRKDKEDK